MNFSGDHSRARCDKGLSTSLSALSCGGVGMSKSLAHVSDLKPDSKNANRGTNRGRAQVERSLRQYGFGRSVLADKHGRIIAGNKTVEIASELGDAPVRVVETTGAELVVVQ